MFHFEYINAGNYYFPLQANETQNTPQSIKSQGFFSTRNHIMKRQKSDNNLKVPSILAKKSRFNQSSQVSHFALIFNTVLSKFVTIFTIFSFILENC